MTLAPVDSRWELVRKYRAIKFFPYQINYIKDRSKYVVVEKSRRIGLTWAEAGAALEYSLRTGENTWFSSSDEKNSLEFIQYVISFAEAMNASIGSNYIDLGQANSERVILPNGARISALSSNPKQLRGKDGRIVLDEFALHDNQEELYRAAHGCTIMRGCLRIISTHNGPGTLFFQLCEGSKKLGYTRYTIPLSVAISQGWAIKFRRDFDHLLPEIDAVNKAVEVDIKNGCINEDAFKQEYGCQPLSLQSLLSAEEYDVCASPDDHPTRWLVPESLDLDRVYRPLHVGIDVGRVHDLTVLWALEEYENPKATADWDRFDYQTVAMKSIKNTTIPIQWEMLRSMLHHQSVSSIAIDPGTVGRALADMCKDEFPFTQFVSFSNPNKARMAERLKGFMQHKKISVPKDDFVRTDFLSLKRKVNSSGAIVYDGGTSESHADRFWAAALALESAQGRTGAEFYHSK